MRACGIKPSYQFRREKEKAILHGYRECGQFTTRLTLTSLSLNAESLVLIWSWIVSKTLDCHWLKSASRRCRRLVSSSSMVLSTAQIIPLLPLSPSITQDSVSWKRRSFLAFSLRCRRSPICSSGHPVNARVSRAQICSSDYSRALPVSSLHSPRGT